MVGDEHVAVAWTFKPFWIAVIFGEHRATCVGSDP